MMRCKAVWLAVAAMAAVFAQPAHAAHHEPTGIVTLERRYVDETRGIMATMGFAGSQTRRIDVKVWYPPEMDRGPYPLIIYSHGTFGFAGNAMHLVRAIVAEGYVVAAPDYPLTSRKAHTKVRFADISDVSQQVRDITFIIDSLLADPVIGKLIDADNIGATGHSLGGGDQLFRYVRRGASRSTHNGDGTDRRGRSGPDRVVERHGPLGHAACAGSCPGIVPLGGERHFRTHDRPTLCCLSPAGGAKV